MTEAVYEAGSWIYKMFFLLIIAVVSVAIVGLGTKSSINTAQLQMDLMRNRILYDPTGIIYHDERGSYPGTISRDEFTQAKIDAAFIYPQNYGGARLTLVDGSNGVDIATVIVNEPTFTRIRTNTNADLKQGGSVQTFVYPVVIVDGTQRLNGLLVIELAMPESA